MLHITNGDSLNDRLVNAGFAGEFLVWREMLCEGPTTISLDSHEFIQHRKDFLKAYYNIDPEYYHHKFVEELQKLEDPNVHYDTIILWFEFDLFCHINMIAAISLLLERKLNTIPIYLVCGGKNSNPSDINGLFHVDDKKLKTYFDNRVLLNENDILLAKDIWTIYCEKDPMKIKAKIKQNSSFPYLSSCLRAHLQRFPNMITGLNVFEENILHLIQEHQISNIKQLVGYVLEYQGYYGYGDLQIKRIIGKLLQFIDTKGPQLQLSFKGNQVLGKERSFYGNMVVSWNYGGVKKYDYLYNLENHKLLKL